MFVIYVSLQYFFTKQKERIVSIISLFSIAGIMLSVATLITVLGIMRGFYIDLVNSMVKFNGDITININTNIKDEKRLDLIKTIKDKYSFVNEVIDTREAQTILISRFQRTGAVIKGIEAGNLESKQRILSNTKFTVPITLEQNEIILGKNLALSLGVNINDTIELVSSTSTNTIFGSIPRVKTLTVANIFYSGMYDYDANVAFVNIETAKTLFPNSLHKIEVYTNVKKSDEYARIMSQDIPKYCSISSWKQMYASLINALNTEELITYIIFIMILIVASFNIISSLFILVNNKSKDIAILKTMGLSNSKIVQIFVIHGLIIGIIGTSLGIILGLTVSKNINSIKNFIENVTGIVLFDPNVYLLSYLPASHIETLDLVCISGICISLCLISSFYPAYRAANINPIQIIRND